uniref:D12 class N6 adenine-specific DNA methyltransferase n=1 Tax=Candidatus Kentrum sp. SD TaxID=2126332 RepID=A0A451BJQ0_9GAMM|nr:MAG: D12 class N6 adenine-specific DNA methyltransferase [Candidatus Kentron sp. SD]VFK43870.1 MAG: D12 class N6 adenine-specific DNA methyltransferase [Candidatus Kentron sp. SD]VFK78520.1 MAG: D12 class N6 adenine-specific DNA methyltransferase [Candidatus Kentron sp. SD]
MKKTARKLGSKPKKQVSPFVKWASGKRHLIPEILARLPASFGIYYESFVGGGAVFFALTDRISQAILSDSNAELRTSTLLQCAL